MDYEAQLNESRQKALSTYSELSKRFVTNFDRSESEAYATLLKDLMDNSAVLIEGGVMSAKEVLDKIEDLQLHLKKAGGQGGKTMGDMFADWFNGEDAA